MVFLLALQMYNSHRLWGSWNTLKFEYSPKKKQQQQQQQWIDTNTMHTKTHRLLVCPNQIAKFLCISWIPLNFLARTQTNHTCRLCKHRQTTNNTDNSQEKKRLRIDMKHTHTHSDHVAHVQIYLLPFRTIMPIKEIMRGKFMTTGLSKIVTEKWWPDFPRHSVRDAKDCSHSCVASISCNFFFGIVFVMFNLVFMAT